jgi:hypothetical protein
MHGGRLYLIALLVLVSYSAVFAVRVYRDGNALPFVVMGTSNTPGNRGYDGQYYYRIATEPFGTTRGFDQPAYRYQRIAYPMAARAVALGDREAIPAALVLINVAAIALGTLAVGRLLHRHGASAATALVWAAYAGQVAGFWRDLAEPMSMFLAAWAILLIRADRVTPAGIVLGVAALTKETTLLFAIAAAVHYAARGRIGSCTTIAGLAALPYLAWQAVLRGVLGHTGVSGSHLPLHLPLAGLTGARDAPATAGALIAVIGPSICCAALVVVSVWASRRLGTRALLSAATSFETVALAANVAFVWMLPWATFADLWGSARTADGLVLAALAHPAFGVTRIRWLLIAAWLCSAPLLWLR